MRSILFVALMVMSAVAVSQQAQNLKELNQILDRIERAQKDSVRLASLIELGEWYGMNQWQKADSVYNEVIDLAKSKGENRHVAHAYLNKSMMAQMYNQDTSMSCIERSIAYAKLTTDTSFQVKLSNNKGLLLMQIGQVYESAEIFTQSLNLSKKRGDTVNIVRSLTYLASIKGNTGDYEGAIRLINDEKNYWNGINDYDKSNILFIKGSAHSGLKQYEKAIESYEFVYPVYKTFPNPLNLIILLNNHLVALIETHQLESAKKIGYEVIELSQSVGFNEGLYSAYVNMSKNFYLLQELDSAQLYIDKVLNDSIRKENPNRYLSILRIAIEVESSKENWKLAKEYSDTYINIEDSLEKELRVKSVDSLLVLNEVEENKAALEQAIADKKSKEQNLLIGGFALFAVLVVGGYLLYKKQVRVKRLAGEKALKEREVEEAKGELLAKLKELAEQQANIETLKERLDALSHQNKSTKEKLSSADIFNILRRNIKKEADWSLFHEYFAQTNQQFLNALNKNHPNLTAYDMRLLSLIRLNLNNNEISVLFNIAPGSVRKSRNRLATKLGIEGEKELYVYLMTKL